MAFDSRFSPGARSPIFRWRVRAMLAASALLFTTGERGALTAGGSQTPAYKSRSAEAAGSAEYFRAETEKLEDRCLSDVRSLHDWQAKRPELVRQLQEMLGLWPMPERTPLNPVITGKLEQEDFKVEKLYFEALPKVYVTANLYLPKRQVGPAPAILYACGHAEVKTNGVSCGNKTAYQHHGIWFARNGYACLMIDTLQLGEIPGDHRGTYSEQQWWWNSRGYTPAGVEAWFGIRALDYLCSRPEVDPERIGMTGRSGGGSYTWTVAAIDERIRVAAPIAGITDLRNQIVDGAVEGHCDCMFFVNTYRWDFPQVAALLAPRPLLIGNSDKDRIFPLDGVVRLHTKVRAVYDLYRASTNLGLLITEGPHSDTQDLQVPVFRWFNRFLKHEQPLMEMVAKKMFVPEQLRVFDKIPTDQRNTKIQEELVPAASALPAPGDRVTCLARLQEKVFAAWPAVCTPSVLNPESIRSADNSFACSAQTIVTQTGVELPLIVIKPARKDIRRVVLTVVDSDGWTNSPLHQITTNSRTADLSQDLRALLADEDFALAFFAPREVRPPAIPLSPKAAAQLRRRYMLLGTTLDSMRVWDLRCAVRVLSGLPGNPMISVRARGAMGVNAAYAALFEDRIGKLDLQALPKSHVEGPDYLNVMRVWDIAGALQTLKPRLASQVTPPQ